MILGIHPKLSNEEYHADTNAISRSGLMQFRKCPAHYWNAYLNPERPLRKDTADMAFGRAFHTLVLEPHLFDEQYCVQDLKLPDVDEKPLKRDLQAEHGKDKGAELYEEAKRKEQCQKEARDRILAAFTAKSGGKELITVDQMASLQLMQQSVLKHLLASRMLTDGVIENSIFWEDKETGVICKTRPDIWRTNMTVDLKTIVSADERSFRNSVLEYGYHLQAAFNREGILNATGNDIKTHSFICVEKKWPHLVAIYYFHQNALDSAHKMFKNALLDFKQCKETNCWPSFETKQISLPAWAE